MFGARASYRLRMATSSPSARLTRRHFTAPPSYPPTKLHDSVQQAVARAKFLAVNTLWNPNFNFDDVLSGGSQAYARVPSLISGGEFRQLESMLHPKILRFVRERKLYPGCPREEIPTELVSSHISHVRLVRFRPYKPEPSEDEEEKEEEQPDISHLVNDGRGKPKKDPENSHVPREKVYLALQVDVRFEHGRTKDVHMRFGGGTPIGDGIQLGPKDMERSYVWTFESLCAELEPEYLDSEKNVEKSSSSDGVVPAEAAQRDHTFDFGCYHMKLTELPPVSWRIVAMNEVSKHSP